jgi:large subunit ribosomal protein L19
MNLLEQIESEQVQKLREGKDIPDMRAGDTVKVLMKIIDSGKERIQSFEGVVIGIKRRGINSSFRVRKISFDEGVERVFPLHSPNIEVILVRQGRARRAKLYYLRNLTGKKARIVEKKRKVRSS